MRYPVILAGNPPPHVSVLTVTFPDVHEAITQGDGETDALDKAADALVCALGTYMDRRLAIPQPSAATPGQPIVALPALTVAKLALYEAMRIGRVNAVELGKRLGISDTAARRLPDLDHRSHIAQVESALAVLGKRLVVDVRDAA